jgi:hypothetical protein
LREKIEKGIVKRNFGKEEGKDYLVYRICGRKSQDLAVHIKLHNYTTKQYKEEFGKSRLKPENGFSFKKSTDNPAVAVHFTKFTSLLTPSKILIFLKFIFQKCTRYELLSRIPLFQPISLHGF